MNLTKQRRLEKAGWKFGTASDFLGLRKEEVELIEMKLALADQIRLRRKKLGVTQTELAKRLASSQSRIAKMEIGDKSASLDSLVRAMLALGVSAGAVGKVISGGKKRGA